MILLLGKNDAVERYAREILKKEPNDIFYCPSITDHYTEFKQYVDGIKNGVINKEIINTQNAEMINVFLKSDLKFDVITAIEINGEIKARVVNKEYAIKCKEVFELELR